jgi:nitrile hydratase accessory protein
LIQQPEPPEPVFAEAWQARAFALMLRLSEREHFTPKEWTQALSHELRNATDDDGAHYYEHWLAALEALVVEKGLTSTASLHERKEAWRQAYLSTPHGKPVELTRARP